jgi:hypothetical protein
MIDNDKYSEKETERRRDEVIRRMANTPPQPKATTPHRPEKKKKAVPGRAVRKVRAGREA